MGTVRGRQFPDVTFGGDRRHRLGISVGGAQVADLSLERGPGWSGDAERVMTTKHNIGTDVGRRALVDVGLFGRTEYDDAWDEFNDYVERNGCEPEPEEYDRLSKALDDAAEKVPWWRR